MATERITIEPFDLRDRPAYELVIDRLAYWYYVPREWLKKVALMNDVYLLNSPFTFQAMEKHAAYCAMIRLGLKVPPTVMVPHKDPPENSRFQYTAAKYNQPFDLAAIAERIGYPLFMKPYDGGQWIGVSRIRDRAELERAYDASGRRCLVRGDQVHPIDYANASPDVALTSLHYYFPWAMKTLLKWCTFCLVTDRRPRVDLDTRSYFEVGDREDLGYAEKLAAYRRLADEYFDADRYHDFCARRLGHVDELVLEWVESSDFDRLLVDTVHATYPAPEQERFVAHLRGLAGQWVREQGRVATWAPESAVVDQADQRTK